MVFDSQKQELKKKYNHLDKWFLIVKNKNSRLKKSNLDLKTCDKNKTKKKTMQYFKTEHQYKHKATTI